MTEQPDTPAITTYPAMDAKIVGLLRLMPDEASLTALYAAQRIEELEARAARSAQTIDGLIRERDAAERERDAARALAEERAGVIARLQERLKDAEECYCSLWESYNPHSAYERPECFILAAVPTREEGLIYGHAANPEEPS